MVRAADSRANETHEKPLRIRTHGERTVMPFEILDDDGAIVGKERLAMTVSWRGKAH